jgi:hypothetical protein
MAEVASAMCLFTLKLNLCFVFIIVSFNCSLLMRRLVRMTIRISATTIGIELIKPLKLMIQLYIANHAAVKN